MGNRATCIFTVGGRISAADFQAFCAIIADYDLRDDWDGEPFDPAEWSGLEPLSLCADEINDGEVPELEAFCLNARLPFRRTSGGCAGAYGPEIVVCHGDDDLRRFAADDDGDPVFAADTVMVTSSLGLLQDAVRFARRDIPPLVVEEDAS